MSLPLAAATTLDQIHSTYLILAVLGALAVMGSALSALGFIAWISGTIAKIIRAGVRSGFQIWERTLSWAGWLGFLSLVGLILAGGLGCIEAGHAAVAIPMAAMVIAAGAIACLAYMHISVERYEVGRGFKALHNPEKGQQLAVDLLRHGAHLGVPMLGSAAAATVLSFALLNNAIYETDGQALYRFSDPDAHPGYLDFLAYTFVNLLRAVDIFDMAKSYQFLSVSLIRPIGAPAYLLIAFKSFFTLFLLQQVFASLRQGWLLAETVTDFWSPHRTVRERAKSVLPQFGPDAVVPILVALRSAATLTQEQREQLPVVLAGIGPAAIPGLVRYLRDRHETSRAVTASALGLLKFLGAVPHLGAIADDPSETVRLNVMDALGRIGEAHASRSGATNEKSILVAREKWWTRARRWPRVRKRNPVREDELHQAVQLIARGLADSSQAVRGRAATAAGQVGPLAQSASPLLVALLQTDADDVRARAAEALGKIRPSEGGAIAALTEAIADPTPAIRIAAAEALGEYREAAVDAVAALVGLLRDSEEAVRTAAASAIARIGVPAGDSSELLVEGLASPDNVVRAQTAESLGLIGVAAEVAAPALAEALTDANDRVRGKAAEALGRMGEAAGPAAVPALVRLLRDEDNWVRALAAEALGEIGAAAEEAGPALLRALRHANPKVRANAAESLGKIRFERARPSLEAACSDPDAGVRSQSLLAVARVGPLVPSTCAILLAAAGDETPEVRAAAVDAIAEWAAGWPEAVEVTVALVADGNADVTMHALQALQKFADYPPAAVEAVLGRLRDSTDSWIQAVAAATLSRMGASAAGAGEELAKVALTGDLELRKAAMRALAILQPEEAPIAFLAGLRDAEADVRKMAMAGLQKLGRVPEDGIEAVVEALLDPDTRVRTTAASVLGQLDPVPPGAIPALIDCTAPAHDDSLRLAAALALHAAGAVVPLSVSEQLLGDTSLRVRLVAANRLLSNNPGHEAARIAVHEALNDPNPRIRELAHALSESLGEGVIPNAEGNEVG